MKTSAHQTFPETAPRHPGLAKLKGMPKALLKFWIGMSRFAIGPWLPGHTSIPLPSRGQPLIRWSSE
jgi:hypothetical protein